MKILVMKKTILDKFIKYNVISFKFLICFIHLQTPLLFFSTYLKN